MENAKEKRILSWNMFKIYQGKSQKSHCDFFIPFPFSLCELFSFFVAIIHLNDSDLYVSSYKQRTNVSNRIKAWHFKPKCQSSTGRSLWLHAQIQLSARFRNLKAGFFFIAFSIWLRCPWKCFKVRFCIITWQQICRITELKIYIYIQFNFFF